MNTEIANLLGIRTDTTGIVIFYSANRSSKSITECGRTPELPIAQALDIYSETPNPASQLLQWSSEAEKIHVLAQHELDIKNPQWLEDLFDCI